MAASSIRADFPHSLEIVWDLVVSLDNYSWRKDLSKVEVIEKGKKFIEYTRDGYATTFFITAFEPYKRYEFDMENDNMKGHWIGLFSYDGKVTTIEFKEDVEVKKLIMRPFAGMYLKKQQASYVKDLREALKR